MIKPVDPSDASDLTEQQSASMSASRDLCGETTDAEQTDQSNPTPRSSLKDYYLSEYDDHYADPDAFPNYHVEIIQPELMSGSLTTKWRFLLKIAASFCVVMALITGGVFAWVSMQSNVEELKASRGVADVAMALTYAQIKHVQPKNQNWSNPDFIRNNLNAILASDCTSQANFDGYGQFSNCPYMLRIYTSSDLSHFLVIAQPAPSLLHWIIPKASIIIDSNTMEMRKFNDLKMLNRLLVNANSLDGVNAGEISRLVTQGELIPLASVATNEKNQGFAPPKALALMKPGAENLVYNAPRYYIMGESVLSAAMNIMPPNHTEKHVNALQQEFNSSMKFPNIVLYSSKGIQHVQRAQKILTQIAPKDKFLVVYLQINSAGQITNTHLLLDESSPDTTVINISPVNAIVPSTGSNQEGADKTIGSTIPKTTDSDARSQDDWMAQSNDNSTEGSSSIAAVQGTSMVIQGLGNESAEDGVKNIEAHALSQRLSALATARQQALKQPTLEMIELLSLHSKEPQQDFHFRLTVLQQNLFDVIEEQHDKLSREYALIGKEFKNIAPEKIIDMIKAAGLMVSFQDYINETTSEETAL